MLLPVTMSSTYLSMGGRGGAPARALRFERGRPIAEFSLGDQGELTGTAEGYEPTLWVGFDGECVVVRRGAKSLPASVDGRPLETMPRRITRLPCRIELGDARWLIDEQTPTFPAHDAGVIVSVARTPAAIEGVAPRGCTPPPVVASGPFAPVAAPRAQVRSAVLVPASSERTLQDGNATSIMPLEVMLQRGLIPTPVSAPAHSPEPRPAAGRRRRTPEARQRDGGPVSRALSQLSRWSEELRARRLASIPRRALVWGLMLPLMPLLCHALSRGSSTTPGVDTGFEAAAWAATDARADGAAQGSATDDTQPATDGAPSVTARRLGAASGSVATGFALPESTEATSAAPAVPASAVPAPIARTSTLPMAALTDPQSPLDGSALSRAAASSVSPSRADTAPRPRRDGRSADERSGLTAERLAVDALAAGDEVRARALYRALAERAPDDVALAEAARILSARAAAPAEQPSDRDRGQGMTKGASEP